MSKSNKYGYSGVDIPTQGFQSNVGKFDPAEINELVQEDKWTQYGQLEHIKTLSGSSTTSLTFTDIKSDIYDVHFATYIVDKQSSGDADYPGWQFAENGTMETGSVYYGTAKWFSVNSGGNDANSTSVNRIRIGIGSQYSMLYGGYTYFYNLGDSTKYSYASGQMSMAETGGTVFNSTYAGVLRQTSFVDQIRFQEDATMATIKMSLYGIRYT
tara:strand:- start:863 stop:1501 length:639 start_codon:yes stop_codon:yes gene_type:complete